MVVNSIEALEKLDNADGRRHMTIAFEDGEVCSSKMIFSTKGNKVILHRTLHLLKIEGSNKYPESQEFNLLVFGYKAFIVVDEGNAQEKELKTLTVQKD